jgi:signal transduction histidine kinase
MAPRERWRASITGALLAVSVLSTAILAMQAHYAFNYHRFAAEQVVRDFARLAASELVRRATAQLGYDGCMVLLTALAQRADARAPAADALARIRADADARLETAAGLALGVFGASPAEGRIVFAPVPPPETVRSFVLARAAAPLTGQHPFQTIHGVFEGEARRFVFAPVADKGQPAVVGFEMDLAKLQHWFSSALERAPLLPPSLGGGRVTNASLFVSVRDPAGVERFRVGAAPAANLLIEMPFGPAYSGVLDGFVVRAAIDPGAARHLVIGGLPRSRLPVLLALLLLSAGLVVTALLQLRRERALARLRSEFVASVSHELRTPLTQIRMFAETLLLDRVRSAEERRRALVIVDREARRLAHLVENVLQFSRGERDSVSLARERRALAPLVREVLEQFQPMIAGSGVRIGEKLDEAAAAAVDADALRQILLNLLDNAVKYGPRQQEIRVGLERDGATVRLSVDDEGPGIPPGERSRVFERFHRLARDTGSAVAGTGIGLAVVQDLARRHGGRAFADAGARGGAQLVVELPAA